MTDIYKKLYGYEDEIQLKDDDIRVLEKGMNLRKMNPSKEEFNVRFYRLDLNNNQLVASTKEFRKKEKLYPLISINEIRSGTGSDNLKEHKLKVSMKDKKSAEEIESNSFVVIYENYKKTLDLQAPSEMERDRWVRVLGYFVILSKKRKGVLPETDKIMRNYFELADTSSDKRVTHSEVTKFLESINLKMKKDQIKKLIKVADTNNDGHLDEEEFELFMQQITQRKEIISLFKLVSQDDSDPGNKNFIPELMPLDRFKLFLNRYQREPKTEQECIEIINRFEPTDSKMEHKFSLYGFTNYMNDHDQFIQNVHNETHVYQKMDLPLSNYFVNSSHNTYLSGDQLTSVSDPQEYVKAIMRGARLLEADCYDGDDGQPKVFHNMTLTSKIRFEDILKAVKPYAFKQSPYPLIITIEMHCSLAQQKTMTELIKKHLAEHLFLDHVDPKNLPTLNQLRNKILFRFSKGKTHKPTEASKGEIERIVGKTLVAQSSSSTTSSLAKMASVEYSDDSDDDSNKKSVSPGSKSLNDISYMSDLGNVISNVSYKGIDYAFQNYDRTKSSSLSESKALTVLKAERAEDIIRFLRDYVIKVYPAGTRIVSSNLDPLLYWIYGFQIVALNFQTRDLAMELNRALFADNGGCGFVLKPEILRNPDLKFNPNDLNTMRNKQVLEIKVISAQRLPQTSELIGTDISDPYVSIYTYGVPADCSEQQNRSNRTKSIKDNGFNPIWNEDFKFVINCPELAFVRFVVRDDDVGKDQLLGEYTIRFDQIRCGYRHIQLRNKQMKGTLFVGIKIYKFESIREMLEKI